MLKSATLSTITLALLNIVPVHAQTGVYHVVDVQAVRATGNPTQWVQTIKVPAEVPEAACNVLVAGAGMGGVAASIRAASRGLSVCLTDPTDWIGGQATAGGVSALDENRFIEFSGGTRSYYDFRNRIRDHYRRRYSLAPAVANLTDFNPGSCYVSALCFEPRVGVQALEAMLEPHRSRIRLFLRTEIVDLGIEGGAIKSALIWHFDKREFIRIRPRFVLDATELGDLLPLAKVPYVVGSESRRDTGEPHASEQPNPACGRVSRTRSQSSIVQAHRHASKSRSTTNVSETVSRSVFVLRIRLILVGRDRYSTRCSATIRRFRIICRRARSFHGAAFWPARTSQDPPRRRILRS
jgi:hypothetical protein